MASTTGDAKVREYNRRYRAANRARLVAYDKQRWAQRRGAYNASRNEQRRANREEINARAIWKRHGLLPEDLAAIYASQQGNCKICREPMTLDEAVIDHDHRCCPRLTSCALCRRGMTHSNCNVAIGLAGESATRLRMAATYVEAEHKAFEQRRLAAGVQLTLDLEAS